jgi:ABC-2 type transport system permease protein
MGIGLFLAAISQTQQQVMFMIFFFLLVFIMMSGIFTPVGSMPEWAQKVNIINPFAYFIKANRMILLKGSRFSDVFNEFISLAVYGMIMFSLAIWRYRKTT